MRHTLRSIGLSLFFAILMPSLLVGFLLTTTAGLTLAVKLANLAVPGKITVQGPEGRLWDVFKLAKLRYQQGEQVIEIEKLAVDWKTSSLWRQQVELQVTWQTITLPIPKSPALSIQHGALQLHGPVTGMTLALHASLAGLLNGRWTAQGTLGGQSNSLKTRIQSAQGNILATLRADQSKTPAINGDIQINSLNLASLVGASLKGFTLQTYFSGDTLTTLSLNAAFSGVYGQNRLIGDAHYANQHLNSQVSLGTNRLICEGELPTPWQCQASLPSPEALHPALEGLKTSLKINLSLIDDTHGTLQAVMKPGSYQAPDAPKSARLDFQGGTVSATLTPESLAANGRLTLDKEKTLALQATLPKFRLTSATDTAQPFTSEVRLDINSLDFLTALSTDLSAPKGKLTATIKGSGTLEKPEFQGLLTLTQGSLTIPALNLTLTPISLNIKTQNDEWEGSANLHANSKALTVKGKGHITPPFSGVVTVKGEQFPVINTKEYQVAVSPDLSLELKPKSVSVRGKLLVPSALIKPITFSDTEKLTKDAVFVREKKETPSVPLDWHLDVAILMGEDVKLDIKGLRAKLRGGIQVKQEPASPLYATGELSVADGQYKAYGQDLKISEGQLIFTGGPITNPGVRVRAVRYFSNSATNFSGSNQLFDFNPDNLQTVDLGTKLTVGIEITGRLDTLKVKLFSIPSTLSQADILSMLILGKPASQANQSGGQLLLTAVSAMNLDSGTKGLQLLTDLKQKLGVDFDIQNNPQFNQTTNQTTNNTTLVVGKALTNRLYLSYNVGLFQEDSGVVILKYLLNKFFSIQVTAGTIGDGIDILYTRSQD